MSLDRALFRLLHERRCLEAFVAGDVSALSLAPDEVDAMQTIDKDQLIAAARKIREGVLHRKHRGSGSLASLFAGTLKAWRRHCPDDTRLLGLSEQFLASVEFASAQEVTAGQGRMCLEEAFFRFCKTRRWVDSDTLDLEFFEAIMRALLINPDPVFSIPPEVADNGVARFCIKDGASPWLFACAKGRLVKGPITPLIARLLRNEGQLGPSMEVHRARAGLVELGLLPELSAAARTRDAQTAPLCLPPR